MVAIKKLEALMEINKKDALLFTGCIAMIFMAVVWIYDLGVKQGQMGALKTAYEVCRKVAPYKDGEGCK